MMKAYKYSEARKKLGTVLDEAERDGAVEIRRRDGAVFRISPLPKSQASPLDVKGVKLTVSTADLVAIVREGRGGSPATQWLKKTLRRNKARLRHNCG